MNILHKIVNEQTLSPTFSWINFTPVFNHNKDSQNEMVQKLSVKQMENLQVIRLEAQNLVLKSRTAVKGTKASLCTSGNAYSLVTQEVFAEIRAINKSCCLNLSPISN